MAAKSVVSARTAWLSAGFVAAVFLLLWVCALLRLHAHYNGEVFLHRGGLTDTLIVVLALPATFVRLFQAYRQTRAFRP